MTLRERASILLWLLRDTVRQSMANALCWLLLGATMVATAVCLSVSVEDAPKLSGAGSHAEFLPANDPEAGEAQGEGMQVLGGALRIGFGAWSIPLARDAGDAVKFLQVLLAGLWADTMGILLALVWTAGFLPSFLDARQSAVLLTKPVARRTLLLGKYFAVVGFVFIHSVLFAGGTWTAMGLRTGVWDLHYWWIVPLLLVHFSIFFGFSLLLAVSFRNTTVCVLGSVLFWALCWGMNYGRHAVVAQVHAAPDVTLSNTALNLVDLGYWVLPKPADLGLLLVDALQAEQVIGKLPHFAAVQQHGMFWPVWSVAASLAFLGFLLAAAVREFDSLDY